MAQFSYSHYGSDSDARMLKIWAHDLSLIPKMSEHVGAIDTCLLHTHQHLVRRLASGHHRLTDFDIIKELACFTRLCSMGNHFLRLLLNVQGLIESVLEVTYEDPQQSDVELHKFIFDHFHTHALRRKLSAKGKRKLKHAECQNPEQERLHLINGPLRPGRIIHCCSQLSGRCQCRDRSHTVQRLTALVMVHMLPCQLPSPQVKEWSAVSAAVDRFVFCNLAIGYGLLIKLAASAFEACQPKASRTLRASSTPAALWTMECAGPGNDSQRAKRLRLHPDAAPAHHTETEPQGESESLDAILNDLSFHRLVGSRVTVARKHILAEDLSVLPHTLSLSFGITAVEGISLWLKHSRKSQEEQELEEPSPDHDPEGSDMEIANSMSYGCKLLDLLWPEKNNPSI